MPPRPDFTQLPDPGEEDAHKQETKRASMKSDEPDILVSRREHRTSISDADTAYTNVSPMPMESVDLDSVTPVIQPTAGAQESQRVDQSKSEPTADVLGKIVCENIVFVEPKHAEDDNLFQFSYKAEEYTWDVIPSPDELHSFPHALERSLKVSQLAHASQIKKVTELHHEIKQFEKWNKISHSEKHDFLEHVKEMLNWFLGDAHFSKTKPIMVFIQVSWLSFGADRTAKHREGYIYKERGGRAYRKGACLNSCKCLGVLTKQKRWMMILDDAVCYANANAQNMQLRSVLWFDSKFKVLAGEEETGAANGLVVTNQSRTLRTAVKGGEREALAWKKAIEVAAGKSKANEQFRFNSFAPVHEGAHVQLLVDGEPYYAALFDALEEAKTSIYITDWWLTPTILLRRGGTEDDSVVAILKRKAEQGITIRITLYREIEAFLYTCSENAAKILSGAHKNIQVQRHPEHGLVSLGENRGVLFWSHHEKLVCIDTETCFIGGLDLCLGRYDNHHHVLQDNDPDRIVFPGKDYSNPVVKDFCDVMNPDEDILDRESDPRMPWHDVHCKIVSKPFARDMAKHFMQLWNHILTDRQKPEDHHYLVLASQAEVTSVLTRKQPNRSSNKSRSPTSRAENRAKSKKRLQGAVRLLGLTKKAVPKSNVGGIIKPLPNGVTPNFDNCSVQFCRSSCEWSNGGAINSSIHSAYVSLIQGANKFIYIENQFFVTCTHRGGNELGIKNRIGEALVSKIEEKHARKEPFKVYVILPLMPAFEADAFAAEEAWQCRQTMYAQYMSIIDSPDSVIGALQESLSTPTAWEDYIVFCCLRQVGSTPDGVVHCTQVYIHSKCCIVDDEHVIIGSANINDRSMLGSRDSEVAVVVSDPTFATSTRMRLWSEHFNVITGDQDTAKARISAMSRKQILADPTSAACWNLWITSAVTLDNLLHEKLHAWPCSKIKSWDDYHACVSRRQKQLEEIQGDSWPTLLAEMQEVTHGSRIVMFPLFFLNNEDMRFPRPVSAKLASNRIFT